MTKTAELEWMEVFEVQKAKAILHTSEIQTVEEEIDKLVSNLYDN